MKKMKKLMMMVLGGMLGLTAAAATSQMTVTSPDGKLAATVTIDQNKNLEYAVSHDGTAVLGKSRLALRLKGGPVLGEKVGKPKVTRKSKVLSKKTPFYRKAEVKEACNTMTLNFGKWDVEFLVMNSAVAYRFVTHYKDSLVVEHEVADFTLAGDCKVWRSPANSGAGEFYNQVDNSWESEYECDKVSKLNKGRLGQGPTLVELADGKKLLISDYCVFDFPGMFLYPAEGNVLKSYYAPYALAEVQGGHNNLQDKVSKQADYIARTAGSRAFPWKLMIVSTEDKQLLDNDAAYALAPDSKIKDLSWIKPGKVAWEWWNDWNLKGVPFKTGVNNDTYKYYIDFASKNGIPYVILDEGWAVNLKADLMQIVPEIDLPALAEYAKQRNVDLVLWAGFKAFERDMEAVCKKYSEMGIKGFKIDFLNRNDQKMVHFTEKAAAMCAKYKLFIDFHGVFPPTGLQCEYPNVLNYEAVYGLEQVKWATKDHDFVRHETLLPFMRTVIGPMDYTQGAMRNANDDDYVPSVSRPMSMGTRCRQLAEYVVYDSPFSMLCDSPTNYEENQVSIDYIAKIPTVWDEIKVLDAKVGEYVVEARRKGNTWWVAGLNNRTERTVTVDLSFIKGAKTAVAYVDGLNTGRNAEDYEVKTLPSVPTKMVQRMGNGGGFALVVECE